MRQLVVAIGVITIGLSHACSSTPAEVSSSQNQSPTPTTSALARSIADSQAASHPLATGFRVESEESVGVSIARPENWDRDAGSKPLPVSGATVDYVVYYHGQPGEIQMMSIQTLAAHYPFESDTDIIRDVLGANEERIAETNLEVIDFASDVRIAGHPAQVMSYRIDDQRSGLPLFSIIAIVESPDQSAVVLQWVANETMQAKTTDLFLEILPTVELLP